MTQFSPLAFQVGRIRSLGRADRLGNGLQKGRILFWHRTGDDLFDAIPEEYYGWWRITETGTWVNDGLDDLGPAMISFTGDDDRLRMHCLLAHINAMGTKSGVAFMWMGAWEYDQMSGTGIAKLGKDGKLKGRIKIKRGDDSTFVAERADPPEEPIPDPPSYRDKWRRRRW